MVKRIKVLFLAVLWMGLIVRPGAAMEMMGTIIDTFSDGITVSATGKVLFNKGDRVELSYRAGQVEMTVGQYEILQAKENVFVARQIAATMPPLRGMHVSILTSLAAGTNLPAVDNAKPRPMSCGERRALAQKMAGAPPVPPEQGKLDQSAGGPVSPMGPGSVNPVSPSGIPGQPAVASTLPPAMPPAQGGCGDFKTTKARIMSGAEPSRRWWLGVALKHVPVDPAAQQPAKRGVKVVAVDPGSPADKADIKSNDMIVEIERVSVKDPGHFIQLLNQANGRVRLVIDRDGKIIKKKVSLEKLR